MIVAQQYLLRDRAANGAVPIQALPAEAPLPVQAATHLVSLTGAPAMQYTRILVPVDFSEGNQRAISIAADLVATSGGELTLLHVIETLADTPFEELADFYGRLEDKARQGMEELTSSITSEPVHSEIRYGRRTEVIIDFAREQMTELIVLSSHSVEREHAFRAWATLSYSVALLAPCSVMLVK